MSDDGNIKLERQQGVLHLVIDRPQRKNALTQAMYAALAEAIEEADGSVRAILLSGAGGCFTSGNDLQDFISKPPAGADSPVARFMRALHLTEKPVVAAIQGPAVGIGTTLLLHCDLVYAGQSAQLQMPFANLGLCPEYASSLLLPRLTGHVRAAQLLLLGEAFSASQALEYGLVNQVVDDAQLLDCALQRCRQLAQQPPAAIRHTKRLMKQALREPVEQAMQREMAYFTSGLQSEEFSEAAEAFVEKRQPDFSRFGS